MSAVVLNEAGLLSAIVSGLIIFLWWPPQLSFQDYQELARGTTLPDGRTVGEAVVEREQLRRHYQHIARLGLGVVIVGFVLQFVAGLLPVTMWQPLW
jgi:hypothetical protein